MTQHILDEPSSSHNLLTPLHAVRAGIESLLAGSHGPLPSRARAELAQLIEPLASLEQAIDLQLRSISPGRMGDRESTGV